MATKNQFFAVRSVTLANAHNAQLVVTNNNLLTWQRCVERHPIAHRLPRVIRAGYVTARTEQHEAPERRGSVTMVTKTRTLWECIFCNEEFTGVILGRMRGHFGNKLLATLPESAHAQR